ncbi:flagellar protein FlaG [Pseudomonas cuatrocienegasensis]|uniref:Flagellar protein FlaG n=1 Tax=Pseudomonas cuatrocienegasensis TaxID=543360 RepID=A0ABY1B3Y5_9PSED|nr:MULTISPECIES: flagellar protein FlaG [Pseudomonas]OEC37146.1 flagellar biosynthesis protein FlaG [Pseudomonas sp. 21C1]SEP87041.1 flagellar protein FlaG [Pseudomonas cuatrocienegasensis]
MDIGSIRDAMKQSGLAPEAVKPRSSESAEKGSALSANADTAQAKVAADKEQAEQPATRAELETAMNNIQEFVQSVRRDLNFSLDDGNGRVVVKVTDANSGDVIRQIPSEEALKLAENLTEVRSLLFKAEA